MTERYRVSRRLKRVTGMTLVFSGVLFWILVIALPLAPLQVKLLPSLGHAQKQSLAVTAGGASLVGGIILLLAPPRRRRRAVLPRSAIPGA
jgi:hypothetical protein